MSVLNGFKKYKNYKADANGDHQLQSFWTSSDTVEDADGNTLTEILANLPNPMVFKGTLGAQADNPTITALPVNGSANIGDTYKVITDGTYAGVTAKVGDMFTCLTKTSSANTWTHIPSGDDSIVIANPSGTAIDELEKISIDNSIYNIKDTKAREDITEVDTTDTTPFLYRETPYEADRVFLDELVGGSVVWNQLVQNGNFADTSEWYTTSGVDSLSVSNNEATVVAKSGYTDNTFLDHYYFNFINGHKYIVSFEYNNTSSIDGAYSYFGTYPYTTISGQGVNSKNAWSKFQRVLTTSNTTKARIRVGMRITSAPSSTWTYKIRNVICIDLTQMFGTTIADYIYSLEQATAGSGIAWLKSYGFFTKDYYPYNTGELISVKTSGKKYVGFNQWDEEWELGNISVFNGIKVSSNTNIRSKNYIQVIGGETYYFTNYQLRMPACYDENKTFISAADATSVGSNGWLLTMPENAKYMLFDMSNNYGTTYNHDICINISKTEGTPKNGDYVPYEEKTYDISNIDLRGIPKLVNNELVYDGDTYDSDGNVTRKYGIVDLGTLDWSDGAAPVFIASFNGVKTRGEPFVTNAIYTNSGEIASTNMADKSMQLLTNAIWIKDSAYSDSTSFIASLSGKYLVYELVTPTTETADPYTNPQICDKDGTEEFIDNRTVPIPVGHNSRYADLPAIMDGDYLSYMARNFASEEYVDRAIEAEISNLGFSIVNGKLCQTYNI